MKDRIKKIAPLKDALAGGRLFDRVPRRLKKEVSSVYHETVQNAKLQRIINNYHRTIVRIKTQT